MHPRFVRVLSPPIAAAAAAVLAVGALPATPAAAEITAYTTTSVNDRAGPGTEYPVLQTLPERTEITVYGCLQTLDWCDVDYQGRGWMSADYIQAYYQGSYYVLNQVASYLQVPTVTFDIASYWSTFYQDQPFYQDMARYEGGGNGGGYSGGYSGGQVEESEFYDRLSPYGDWAEINGRYVWVPSHVSSDWRPYQEGRWVDTDEYGWMWVSDEPFGWATYHYGRWAYSNRVGWFWVPGTRWAPAWVAWRSSGSYVAWAPLPPEPESGISINININQVPNYYWDVVPGVDFLAANLSRAIIRDQQQAQTYLQQTQPLGVVQVNGPRVVNNVLNVTQVENITKKTVIIHNVTEVQNPQTAGKISGKTVQIYTPKPTSTTTTTTAATVPAKPPKLVALTQVEQVSKTKGQSGNQPTTANLVQPLNKQLQLGTQSNGQLQNSTLSGKLQTCPAGTTLQANGKCAIVQVQKNGKAGKLNNLSSAGTPPPPPTSTTPLKTPPPLLKNGVSPDLEQPTLPSKTAICPSGETLQPNGKCATAQLPNNGKGTQLSNPSLGKNLKLNNTPPPPTSTTPLKTPPPLLKNGVSPNLALPTSPSKTVICPSGETLQPNGKCGTAQLSTNGKGTQLSNPSLGKNLKLNNPPPPPTVSQHDPKVLKQTMCPNGTVREANGSCVPAPTNGKSQTMLKGPSTNLHLQSLSHTGSTPPPPPPPTMVAPAHIQAPKAPNVNVKTLQQPAGGNDKTPKVIKCPPGEVPQPNGSCGKGH